MRFDSLKNAMFMLISHGIGGAIYMFGIVRFEKYGKADLYGIEKEANRSEKARSEGLELPGTFCDWDRTGQNYYFDKTDYFTPLFFLNLNIFFSESFKTKAKSRTA